MGIAVVTVKKAYCPSLIELLAPFERIVFLIFIPKFPPAYSSSGGSFCKYGKSSSTSTVSVSQLMLLSIRPISQADISFGNPAASSSFPANDQSGQAHYWSEDGYT
jgi:hypothetical protein